MMRLRVSSPFDPAGRPSGDPLLDTAHRLPSPKRTSCLDLRPVTAPDYRTNQSIDSLPGHAERDRRDERTAGQLPTRRAATYRGWTGAEDTAEQSGQGVGAGRRGCALPRGVRVDQVDQRPLLHARCERADRSADVDEGVSDDS